MSCTKSQKHLHISVDGHKKEQLALGQKIPKIVCIWLEAH